MTVTITLLGIVASAKRENPAEPSIAVLGAGIPVAMADGGYFIIR